MKNLTLSTKIYFKEDRHFDVNLLTLFVSGSNFGRGLLEDVTD
jgi:hypothetical protein